MDLIRIVCTLRILEETRNQNLIIEKEEDELLSYRVILVNKLAELVTTIESAQRDFRLNENQLVVFETTLKNYSTELEQLQIEKTI